MKKRLHFYIVGGILLIGIILGSIFDLQINEFLFDRYNGFGLAVSAFGMIPGYGSLTFMGGVLFALTLHSKEFKTWLKIIFYILSVAMYGLAVFFLGRDVFNINGFYSPQIEWLGFLIMGLINIPIGYFGYWMGKKNTNPKMWIIILILGACMFVALVPFTTLLKSIMHRPRYRIAIFENYVDFHNWWEPTKDYKDIIAASNGVLDSGEFKSFPSGHACATMCSLVTLILVPMLEPKLKDYDVVLFYSGAAWTVLVMFSRMLVGAHFLSDVCFGALITLVCVYIGNEIVVRKCLPKEEPEKEVVANE